MTRMGLAARIGVVLALAWSGSAAAQEVYWDVHKVMTLTRPEEWKFQARVQVGNFDNTTPSTERVYQATRWFDTQSGNVFFPLAPSSGHAQAFMKHFGGSLMLNDVVVDDEAKVYVNRQEGEPLPGGSFLVEMGFGGFSEVKEMTLVLTWYGRSWRTEYDEAAARSLGWPTEWPAVCKSVFEPEMWVDYGPSGPYDMSKVREKVLEWTEGNPQALPPALTAKWLAMKVAEAYRPSGRGVNGPAGSVRGLPASTTALGAFWLDGPSHALAEGRGSKFDLVTLLVASYRAAGIPARVVIGYDFRKPLNKPRPGDADSMRAWVEFALYDEHEADEKRRLVWVPVDIVKLQASSAWTQDFERPLKYFGTHDELDEVIPIAYHFNAYWVPGVSYGTYLSDANRAATAFGPALWSWNAVPGVPSIAGQWLSFQRDSPMAQFVDPLPEGARKGRGRRP
jgi:hypothetical protein